MSRRAFRSPLRTLTGQITALVVLAALVGAVLTGATLFWLAYNQKTGMMPELAAASEAARIATIVREARPITSPDDQSRDLPRQRAQRRPERSPAHRRSTKGVS